MAIAPGNWRYTTNFVAAQTPLACDLARLAGLNPKVEDDPLAWLDRRIEEVTEKAFRGSG